LDQFRIGLRVTSSVVRREEAKILEAKVGAPLLIRGHIGTAVVMLTNYVQDALVLRSLAAGAKGYLVKDVELADLKKMIRSVCRGGFVLDAKVAGRVIAKATGERTSPAADGVSDQVAGTFSETDLAILRCLAEGLSNKEIAQRVNLSPHTIKDHLDKMFGLLAARSRSHLVAEAIRRGLI
jgi:DNA-binding NarL/FixJ family response regulator